MLDLGGPDDEPELYDLADDPGEQNNVYRELGAEGEVLCERTLSFLESVGTAEEYLAPRGEAFDRWWEVICRNKCVIVYSWHNFEFDVETGLYPCRLAL